MGDTLQQYRLANETKHIDSRLLQLKTATLYNNIAQLMKLTLDHIRDLSPFRDTLQQYRLANETQLVELYVDFR